VVFVLSLILSIVITPRRPEFSFYMIVTRAWELLAGACVALRLPGLQLSERGRVWLCAAGLLLVVVSALFLSPGGQWPGYAACLPVGGAALVLLARNESSALLGNGVAQFLGNSSYSIYLWHWPIVVALDHLQLSDSAEWKVAGIVGAVFVGWLSYRLIETPGRRWFGRGKPLLEVSLFAGSLAVIAVIGAFVVSAGGLPTRSNMRGYAQLAEQTRVPAFTDGVCVANDSQRMGLKYEDKYLQCVTGDTSASRTILLWGDSHAGHFAPMMAVLARNAHLRLKVFSSPACVPVFQSGPSYALGINPDVCLGFKEDVRKTIRDYEFVVLAARWDKLNKIRIEWSELVQTLADLQAAGARVVILGQAPDFDKNASKMYIYSQLFGYPMPSHLPAEVTFRQANQQVRALAAKFSNTVFVDPASVLCHRPGLDCDVLVGGKTIYSDYDHLSAQGSAALARVLLNHHTNFLSY